MTQPPEHGWLPDGEFLAPPTEFAPPTAYYGPPSGWSGPSEDVAFFDVSPVPSAPDRPDPFAAPTSPAAPLAPLSPLVAGTTFLWAACAFGAVIGPFLTFGSYAVSSPSNRYYTTVDGWGRYVGSGTAGHGVIWGIPLIFCAAMLAIAVLGVLWRRPERWPPVLGLVASAALVTTALGAALEAESRASAMADGSGLQTGNGAGLWLTLFVGLAAAIAGLLSLRLVLDAPAQLQPHDTNRAMTESTADSAAPVPPSGT